MFCHFHQEDFSQNRFCLNFSNDDVGNLNQKLLRSLDKSQQSFNINFAHLHQISFCCHIIFQCKVRFKMFFNYHFAVAFHTIKRMDTGSSGCNSSWIMRNCLGSILPTQFWSMRKTFFGNQTPSQWNKLPPASVNVAWGALVK